VLHPRDVSRSCASRLDVATDVCIRWGIDEGPILPEHLLAERSLRYIERAGSAQADPSGVRMSSNVGGAGANDRLSPRRRVRDDARGGIPTRTGAYDALRRTWFTRLINNAMSVACSGF
jgi:hypothetical protein